MIRCRLRSAVVVGSTLACLSWASPALAGGGTLSIIAGTGSPGAPIPGPAASSPLNDPNGVVVDSAGNLYIADVNNDVIEKVTPSGTLSIIAGTGSSGAPIPGPATSSPLDVPRGLAVDSSGNLIIADSDNSVVEKVTPSGTLSIIAGRSGSSGAPIPGPATSSPLDGPTGVAVDPAGNLYIADEGNNQIYKVTPSGTLSIIAGTGGSGTPTPGPAASSQFYSPADVAVDSVGNLYIADQGNNLIEKVIPSGTLSIIAGTPGSSGTPTPGPATSSPLNNPLGVAVDSVGNLYIADQGNNVIEEVTPSGTLSIIAGTGSLGAATPGPATSSPLSYPGAVAVVSPGNFYIADSSNSEVEHVTPATSITTTPAPAPPATTTAPTTTTPTTPTTTTPATTTPTRPSTPPVGPVQLRITGISVTSTTIVWCQGAGCQYPTTRLRFALNRATSVRLLLRTLVHGHWKQVATTTLHGRRGINRDRIAGRWHGHLVPTGAVQILVQIQRDQHWRTAKTIGLTVRHTSQRR
jgi:DNA-binding beta-propeller fold protein YncE